MKKVVKRANAGGGAVKSRSIPENAIAQARDKIENMESEIAEIRDQEKEEKAIRVAEMEANRARNLMEFEEDIQRRPRRTWRGMLHVMHRLLEVFSA